MHLQDRGHIMTYGRFANQMICGFALIASTCLAPVFAQAQDASNLSAEELQALFEQQRTRGLVIVPAEGTDTAAVATEPTTDVAADPAYTEVAAEAQINFQISFEFDSAALRDSEKAKLTSLCEALNASDIPLFRIVGHTDAKGSDSYNQGLSLLRAEEVKRYLVDDCQVDAARLEATGVGEAFPFDAADPNAETNRRVEFQVAS
jgi:OmpA-OmpF porin, OOP family